MTAAGRSTKVVVVDVIDRSTAVLHIVGDFDALTVAEGASALLRVRRDPPVKLHIDATACTFLDSTGIAALAMVADAVRRHGGEVTAAAAEGSARLIELCGLSELLGYTPA